MSNRVQPKDVFLEEERDNLFTYMERSLDLPMNSGVFDQILENWNKNKRTLFHALGNQLRVEIDLKDIDQYKYERNKRMRNLGINYVIYSENHFNDFRNHYRDCSITSGPLPSKIFCINYLILLADRYFANKDFTWEEIQSLVNLQSEKALVEGVTQTEINIELHNFKVPKGTKIMRALQKTLKFLEVSDEMMAAFQQFRNEMSNITTTLSSLDKATLVLSIHPLDFISLSDNDCGWNSCFSWLQSGEYRQGCIETMTSNLTMIAYLKSKKDFVIGTKDNPIMTLPNKNYRQLFYVHKDIILSGHGYPYQDKKLSLKILDKINNLVYNNLNWKYQFMNQQYFDMENIEENITPDYRYYGYGEGKDKKRIIFYSDGHMYNDLAVNRSSAGHWCNRNKVDKTIFLNISGPSYCLSCGDYFSGSDEAEHCFCDDCYAYHVCDCCDTVYQDTNNFSYIQNKNEYNLGNVCNSCIEENYVYDTIQDEFTHMNELVWRYKEKYGLTYGHRVTIEDFDFIKEFHGRYITIDDWKKGEKCRVA